MSKDWSRGKQGRRLIIYLGLLFVAAGLMAAPPALEDVQGYLEDTSTVNISVAEVFRELVTRPSIEYSELLSAFGDEAGYTGASYDFNGEQLVVAVSGAANPVEEIIDWSSSPRLCDDYDLVMVGGEYFVLIGLSYQGRNYLVMVRNIDFDICPFFDLLFPLMDFFNEGMPEEIVIFPASLGTLP